MRTIITRRELALAAGPSCPQYVRRELMRSCAPLGSWLPIAPAERASGVANGEARQCALRSPRIVTAYVV
jgi:hypothetical protein